LDVELIGDQLRAQDNPWQIALVTIIGFLVLMFALRLLGIAWYVMRFYDYRLMRHGNDLRISCGLFTKVSATVPRQRIQFISVHRPWLLRCFGLASIRIETAGGAGSENENAAATVSRRWFLPVVAEMEVNRILKALRPELEWNSAAVNWQGVSPLTTRRLARLALVFCLLLSLIGLAFYRSLGWLAGPIVFPFLLALAVRKSRSKKYARTEWGIAYQSGIFNRKLSFSFYDRIQGIQLSQSPFDRRWRMATLAVDTAAAGPAEHAIAVRYLDQEFAIRQFDELQAAAAHHRPTWA
jgi:putative membrane protein